MNDMNLPPLRVIAVLLWLLGHNPSATAAPGDTARTRQTLRGVHSVVVTVDIDGLEAAQKIGLSKDSLRTDVELKLRQNGITVITEAKGADTVSLSVRIVLTPSGQGGSVNISVSQQVQLLRDPSMAAFATTWDVGGALSSPSAKFIRDTVGDSTNDFLNAWLSVNPQTR